MKKRKNYNLHVSISTLDYKLTSSARVGLSDMTTGSSYRIMTKQEVRELTSAVERAYKEDMALLADLLERAVEVRDKTIRNPRKK